MAVSRNITELGFYYFLLKYIINNILFPCISLILKENQEHNFLKCNIIHLNKTYTGKCQTMYKFSIPLLQL